jgi:hypothetical protein
MTVLNTRGRIAALLPTTTAEQQLYVVPSVTEVDAVLRICNQDAVSQTYRVAHCQAGHGDVPVSNAGNWIWYDKVLPPSKTDEVSLHMGPTETIRVKASVGSKLSFHLSGNVKVTS